MRALHIILLLVYCHFTMAGFAGAWVMKRDLRTEERATIPMADMSDPSDDGGAADDDDSCPSPGDPDQCHRPVPHMNIAMLPTGDQPAFALHGDGRASLRPIDITTPPPRA